MDKFVRQVLVSRVYDVAIRTPLTLAKKLSAATGNSIYLKREDLQPVHSFKLRGAYNKLAQLSSTEKRKGVIAASAGNHAQGVALSAKTLGIKATIVMPATTPQIKIDAVKSHGARVVLHGDSYSEAAEHCRLLQAKTGKVLIHPYDDPQVIAGQGTIGMEITEQLPEVNLVFVPVGGGGLIAGIASYLKAVNPKVKIIGVEPTDSPAMYSSLKARRRVVLNEVGIFADGVATKHVGKRTFAIVKRYVDEMMLVTNDELCAAIKTIYEDTRSIVEPAGALGVAGIQKYLKTHKLSKKNLVAINSGANMNFERLQFVAERTLTGIGVEALYAVTLQERPGALDHFVKKVVGDHSITEFNYRMANRQAAHIFVGIRLNNGHDKLLFERNLNHYRYQYVDLTNNELAKGHIRHMVGGKTADSRHEVLYNFIFPERKGALQQFLRTMQNRWNISLFHYRANGGDAARVLIGLEVPPPDKRDFQKFLEKLHYPYTPESKNVAYSLFL